MWKLMMKSKMSSMGLIHNKDPAIFVYHICNGFDIGEDPLIAWGGDAYHFSAAFFQHLHQRLRVAAGGQGAPLVPYAEYLIYRRDDQTVGLQNIGGIGNLTVLPRGGAMGDTFAFDTGPGNMVMDQIVERMTGGRRRYDENGAMAAGGACSGELLAWMMNDPYLMKKPPKSTGREVYGAAYVDALMRKGAEAGLRGEDILATAARFTAECVRVAVQTHCRVRPDILVVGGGGSRNPTLMALLRDALSPMPVLTNEDLGYDSDAKEAVAFAVLANECVHGHVNSMPSVTGARHPVVMGKISL